MFDLERAIEQWRRQMLAAGITTPEPLEELESHLREEVDQQADSGRCLSEAFAIAVERVGPARALKAEFRKVARAPRVWKRKLVWVLSGLGFLSCWLEFGESPAVMLVYGVLLAGLIVASFIDGARFAIPDALTLGGIGAGLLSSVLLPELHGQRLRMAGMGQSLLGIGVGAGLLYLVLRLGQLAFGRQKLALGADTRILFTDGGLVLPGKVIPNDELFYRESDAVTLHARVVEIGGLGYREVPVRLTRKSLRIGDDEFNPAEAGNWEATVTEIVLPREAMGLGDVKLLAAIGAFLGWQGAAFSLAASSLIGCLVAGASSIAWRRSPWAARVPYGPFLALAAAIWVFAGKPLVALFVP